MRELTEEHDNIRFLVACYRPEHETECRRIVSELAPELPIHFFIGRTHEIIEVSDFCHMVSGSVSLEMLARRTPAVVLYRITRFEKLISKLILTCDYITLPNLIAQDEIIPEFVSYGDPDADRQQNREAFVVVDHGA